MVFELVTLFNDNEEFYRRKKVCSVDKQVERFMQQPENQYVQGCTQTTPCRTNKIKTLKSFFGF